MNNKRLILVIVAIVVILGSVISLIRTMRRPAPRKDVTFLYALGEIGGQEISRGLGGSGDVVILVPDRAHTTKAMKEMIGKLTESLQQGGATVLAEKPVALEPDQLSTSPGYLVDAYLQAIEEHPDAAGVISVLGPPVFTEEDLDRVPAKAPGLILVGEDLIGPRHLRIMKAGLLKMTIMHRSSRPPDAAEPQTAREVFDQYFEVVKAKE